MRTTVKLADKARNLELLGRHLALFQDNVKISGLNGWALVPRLNLVLGLGLALMIVRALRGGSAGLRKATVVTVGLLAVGFGVSLWAARGPERGAGRAHVGDDARRAPAGGGRRQPDDHAAR